MKSTFQWSAARCEDRSFCFFPTSYALEGCLGIDLD